MSAVSNIFAEVDARIGLDAIDGLQSYERMPSGDPDTFPALEVYETGLELIESETANSRWTLSFTVAGYVEGFRGGPVHDAMSDLHATALAGLVADDAKLGMDGVELIEAVGTRRTDIAELASKKRLGFAQDFEVQFATPRGDLSQFA